MKSRKIQNRLVYKIIRLALIVSLVVSSLAVTPLDITQAQSAEAFRFVDDFNVDEIGQAPSNWVVANKPGITGKQSTILVKDFPDGTGKGLEIQMQESAATGQDPFLHAKLDRAVSGNVVIEGKIKMMDTGISDQAISVRDANNANTTSLVRFSRDGHIYGYNGTESVLAVEEPYDLNTWYQITAVLDISRKTYDLYIDGTKVQEGLSFLNQNMNNVMYVRIQAWARVNNAETTAYYDDIKVLEPGIRAIGPFDDAENVDVNIGQLNMEFNTPMELNTLNPAHIVFTNETEQQIIPYHDYSSTETTYSFQLDEPLKPFHTYAIHLQDAVDSYGQTITQRLTFQTNDPAFGDQENLLINGSFETVDDEGWPSSWGNWIVSGNPQYTIDETVYKHGSQSLKISADVQSRANISQRINLEEEQREKAYRIEQWMRMEEFTGNAYFRIQVYDQDDQRIDYIESNRIYQPQANDWSLVEMEVFLPENAVRLSFEAFFENGTGTVWFDDSRFYEYVHVSHIQLDHDEVSLMPGETEQLTASLTMIPEHASKPNVVWESSDESIVTVDEGLITAHANGIAAVTARTMGGVKADSIVIVGEMSNITAPDYRESVEQGSFVSGKIEATSDSGEVLTYTKLTNPNHGTVQVTEDGHWTYEAGLDSFLSDRFHILVKDESGNMNVSKVTLNIQQNLLTNGSFETIDTGGWASSWNKSIFSGSPQYTVDESTYKDGLRSLKISADATSRGSANQRFTLEEEQRGKIYRLEQWMKMEDFTGIAYFRIQVYDQDRNRLDYIESDKIFEANDWKLVEMDVYLSEDAEQVVFETFFENGTGTVWYDNTRFYEYTELIEILLQDEISLLPGESAQLAATLNPENATEQDVVWESSDEAIATVDEGVVTAHADGIAAITARSVREGVKADSLIIVGDVAGITVPHYEASVQQGDVVTGKIEGISDAGQALTYTKLTDPNHGIIQFTEDGQWTYYADDNYSGSDRFIVVVEDESGNYNASRVTLDVLPAYQAPELEEVIQPTDKNTPVDGQMIVLQPNGETLSFHIEEHPSHGIAVMDTANGHWTYTPDPDYVGKDSFTVRVENEHGAQVTLVRLYAAPDAEDIINELKASNPNHSHPRLLATADDFTRMRSLLENNDENMVKWFETIRASADAILPLPLHEYAKPDGLRLDTTSSRHVTTLAFVYQLTGDPVYAERAWEEMEFVASDAYPDWSPGHFLDTATMTHGIALGYDWLYDYLSEERRAVVRQGIAEKGLSPAVPMYLNQSAHWVYNRLNWNFVTNAGMTLGALAIADEEEELAGLILQEAFKSIQYGLTQYAPDGSAFEGPAYWEYGTSYLVYFLSALETTFGHDFNFSDREGIAETPLYPIHFSGPNGTFNHGDNGSSPTPGRLLLWFAERYNKPEYTWYHQFVGSSGLYDMIWYRPDTYGAEEPVQLDKWFERPKAVTMRSNWSDPNALFVGFKGGENGSGHGDLDIGSFVFDAYGVRWALDVGNENYNLPGFFNYSGPRWNYYRKNTEGHNTLLIRSSSSTWPDQDINAVSHIVRTEFERPEGSFAIADLTPAYQQTAASVKRGTALIDHRRQFLIQDEIKLKETSELYWFMHTRAQIEIDDDGQTAWLSQGGRQLAVQLMTPAEARFSVLDAEPLPSSPNPTGQTRNIGIKKLTIHLEDQLETTIAVRMIPILPGETPALDDSIVVPLDEWMIEAGQLTQLESLTINGEAVVDFTPERYVYDVEVPLEQNEIPVVGAHAGDGYEVTIVPAEQLPGTTRIEVVDPSGSEQTATYYVVFQTPPQTEIPEGAEQHIPIAVTASTHDGNIPENTLDGDLTTRWSAEGAQWIQYDLGEVKDLSAAAIAWYQGNVRQSYFHLELSEDGEQWKTVHEGFSSGETTDVELTLFAETPAQYVRIKGFGNSVNQWNSIAEVMIYGPADDEQPTPVTTSSLQELVASLAEDDAFANDQAIRAISMHLTAVQVFEQQENAGKVVQHMEGLQVLLDHQWDQGLMSEGAYNALKVEVDKFLAQWL